MTFKRVNRSLLGKTSVALISTIAAGILGNTDAQAASHVVRSGESFFAIASQYSMDPYDLAAQNGKMIYDTINPGDTLQVQSPVVEAAPVVATTTTATEAVVLNTPTATGNSFPVGQCTWGVKELAPWVNNWWGNAKDWAVNAAAYNGYATGTTPVVGAIAVWDGGEFGHVAYVTDVYSQTSIQVLEANYRGQQQIANYRGWFDPTTAQGTVTYIYPW